jgi:hypothetical protein
MAFEVFRKLQGGRVLCAFAGFMERINGGTMFLREWLLIFVSWLALGT